MKLTQEPSPGEYRIRRYEQGRLTVNEEEVTTSVVVSVDRLISDWSPQSVDEIALTDLDTILELEPEVVLLGTGAQQRFPERTLLRTFLTKGIGIEVMDTGAASRTFNVLAAEDRRVVAALLLR